VWARFNADVERGDIGERPGRIILGATAASVLAAIVVAVVTQRPLTALVVAPLGPIVAWVYVTRRASSWYAHFDATLADSLTVLASSLRAGHSLLQAIAHVAEEADDRIAAEWQETVRRTRLGVTVEHACSTGRAATWPRCSTSWPRPFASGTASATRSRRSLRRVACRVGC
jgi:tight adherence protein B